MRRLTLLLSFLLPLYLSAQNSDTTAADTTVHDPTTATLRSVVLPGLGQIYNEKYWKVPIVYAGIGGSIYFIDRNTRNYKKFRGALIARNDPDRTDDFEGIYNEEQLRTLKETYRRWRDLSYISLVGFYVLQIVDANVDAHLHGFDVSDDLSLRIRPWSGSRALSPSPMPAANGLSFSFHF